MTRYKVRIKVDKQLHGRIMFYSLMTAMATSTAVMLLVM